MNADHELGIFFLNCRFVGYQKTIFFKFFNKDMKLIFLESLNKYFLLVNFNE